MLEKAFQNCFKPPQVNLSGIWESTPRLRIRSHQRQKRVPSPSKKAHRGKSRDSAILSRVRGISFAVEGNRESAQCALLERNRRSGRKTLSCFRWFPCLQRLWLKHTKRLILELAEAQPELVIVSGMARESIPLPIKPHLMKD